MRNERDGYHEKRNHGEEEQPAPTSSLQTCRLARAAPCVSSGRAEWWQRAWIWNAELEDEYKYERARVDYDNEHSPKSSLTVSLHRETLGPWQPMKYGL